MKSDAMKVGREIVVGSIVKVSLKVVNCTKVDDKNLTLVIVEKVQPRIRTGAPKYWLVCAKGLLNNVYTRV